MKILSAVLIVAMLVFLWPRAAQMMRESRKGSQSEWLNVILILVVVVGFVALLMHFVRG
ncbi:MAG: hypothetical protein PF483_09005 [Halothiobacillus sp.]|nr:hypothetical protein [Halothiobacillus sp.]